MGHIYLLGRLGKLENPLDRPHGSDNRYRRYRPRVTRFISLFEATCAHVGGVSNADEIDARFEFRSVLAQIVRTFGVGDASYSRKRIRPGPPCRALFPSGDQTVDCWIPKFGISDAFRVFERIAP